MKTIFKRMFTIFLYFSVMFSIFTLQLGDGTTVNQLSPKKIMENVIQVCATKITIDNEIPVIDIVACYASSNPNYKSNSTTIINTYNPGTSTSYISDDDEIWHNQTNEVLKETIPNAILNNISNSSKEPTQKPNKVTKFLMEKLF